MPEPDSRSTLWPLRITYFLTFGALGAVFPFLSLLLSRRGLDAQQISFVMVTIPVSGLLLPPLWGYVADKRRVRGLLLALACGGAGLFLVALGLANSLIGITLAMLGFAIFRAPITSLIDASAFEALGGGGAHFSTLRVWGSVGFALFALVTGQLDGSASPAILIGIAALAYALAVPFGFGSGAQLSHAEHVDVRMVLRSVSDPAMLLILLATAFYYFSQATFDAYFALHAHAMGLRDGAIGLAWSLGVGVEIALMLLAPRFLDRLSAARWLQLCSVVAVLRWSLTAWATQPFFVITTQALHGVTFGVWYLALGRYVQTHAKPQLRSSMQAVTLASMGLGMVLGYLIGGQLLLHHGGSALYSSAAASSLLALLVYRWAARPQAQTSTL